MWQVTQADAAVSHWTESQTEQAEASKSYHTFLLLTDVTFGLDKNA